MNSSSFCQLEQNEVFLCPVPVRLPSVSLSRTKSFFVKFFHHWIHLPSVSFSRMNICPMHPSLISFIFLLPAWAEWIFAQCCVVEFIHLPVVSLSRTNICPVPRPITEFVFLLSVSAEPLSLWLYQVLPSVNSSSCCWKAGWSLWLPAGCGAPATVQNGICLLPVRHSSRPLCTGVSVGTPRLTDTSHGPGSVCSGKHSVSYHVCGGCVCWLCVHWKLPRKKGSQCKTRSFVPGSLICRWPFCQVTIDSSVSGRIKAWCQEPLKTRSVHTY